MTPESRLYCIGGGNPSDLRMIEHYRYFVELLHRNGVKGGKPGIALLPTAHRNGVHPNLRSLDFMEQTFAELSCATTTIYLGELPEGQSETTPEELESILGSADGLFVLGGDTRYMLDVLRSRDLADTFLRYLDSGLPFAGSSAGTIWLAELAMSDSESFTWSEGWDYIMLEGLGVLPFVMNVHDDQGVADGALKPVARRFRFEEFLREYPERPALVVDEFVALEICGGRCTVRSPQAEKGAWLTGYIDGEIRRCPIETEIDLNTPEDVAARLSLPD